MYEYGPYKKRAVKLNYNCPESEKSGSGPGSCSGSSGKSDVREEMKSNPAKVIKSLVPSGASVDEDGGGSGGGGKSGRGGGGGSTSTNVADMASGITNAKITGTLPSDTKEVGVRIRGYLSAKEIDLIKREGFKFDRDKKEWYDPSSWSPKGITEGIKGSRLRMLGKSATIEFRKVA